MTEETIQKESVKLAVADVWRELSSAIADIGSVVYADPRVENDLVRAEGVRYLTRLLTGGFQLCLEGWDWRFPKLIQFLSPQLQWGLPAPDCRYLWAAVHGDAVYRVYGTRGTSHLFDIESRRGHVAHLATFELCDRRSEWDVDPDGGIEIVLSREEALGNWVRLPDGPGAILIRQYHYDWLTEEPAMLEIEREGTVYPPSSFSGDQLLERMQLMKDFLRGVPILCQQIVNQYYEAPADSLVFGPIDLGWADLQYGKGHYRCGSDEAVIIELTPPDADYWSVQLVSHFWDARDWNVRQTSINGYQAVLDDDGRFRAVIAQRDPGVVNWLDAGGLEVGLIGARYYKADAIPLPTIRTVPLARLDDELPATTRRLSSEQRQQSLRARALSVRRRFCD